ALPVPGPFAVDQAEGGGANAVAVPGGGRQVGVRAGAAVGRRRTAARPPAGVPRRPPVRMVGAPARAAEPAAPVRRRCAGSEARAAGVAARYAVAPPARDTAAGVPARAVPVRRAEGGQAAAAGGERG